MGIINNIFNKKSKDENDRSRSMCGSCAYVCINTTKVVGIKFMGILIEKSSLIIFQRWSNLKYKFGQRNFWCRGYYVDMVGKNAKRIAEYVKNQMKEDMMYDQISIKEYKGPFNG